MHIVNFTNVIEIWILKMLQRNMNINNITSKYDWNVDIKNITNVIEIWEYCKYYEIWIMRML